MNNEIKDVIDIPEVWEPKGTVTPAVRFNRRKQYLLKHWSAIRRLEFPYFNDWSAKRDAFLEAIL